MGKNRFEKKPQGGPPIGEKNDIPATGRFFNRLLVIISIINIPEMNKF
jgi:hypothetical protein